MLNVFLWNFSLHTWYVPDLKFHKVITDSNISKPHMNDVQIHVEIAVKNALFAVDYNRN